MPPEQGRPLIVRAIADGAMDPRSSLGSEHSDLGLPLGRVSARPRNMKTGQSQFQLSNCQYPST
jgi:hypothetical protein